MQLLFDESEEFGATAGLRLIPGRVVPIPAITSSGGFQKIPHIGWNELVLTENNRSWQGGLLAEVSPGEAVYFVHSFMAVPESLTCRLADCVYGGISISAAVKLNNIFGCQFHPEKSGLAGLTILKNFLVYRNS